MEGRKRLLIKKMAITLVEVGIILVVYLQVPVNYAESIGEVLASFVMMDLGDPPVQVLAVEENGPLISVFVFSRRIGATGIVEKMKD